MTEKVQRMLVVTLPNGQEREYYPTHAPVNSQSGSTFTFVWATMNTKLEEVVWIAQDFASALFEDSGALRRAIESKMVKNESREFRHGAAY